MDRLICQYFFQKRRLLETFYKYNYGVSKRKRKWYISQALNCYYGVSKRTNYGVSKRSSLIKNIISSIFCKHLIAITAQVNVFGFWGDITAQVNVNYGVSKRQLRRKQTYYGVSKRKRKWYISQSLNCYYGVSKRPLLLIPYYKSLRKQAYISYLAMGGAKKIWN